MRKRRAALPCGSRIDLLGSVPIVQARAADDGAAKIETGTKTKIADKIPDGFDFVMAGKQYENADARSS